MRVTRTVDVDRLFGEVLTRAYARMGQEAANEAVDLAPVDRGHLKSSMMLQHGDVTYKGGGINIVAIWRPREKGKASTGPGPLEYGSYLNRPTGGTETVPAGKRTYPGPRSTGSGKLFGRHSGTWEWNVQTGETVYNSIWAEIAGYTLDELSPISIQTWQTLAHPEDQKKAGELLSQHFEGKIPFYHSENRMKHKDGHWIWVLDRGKVFTWTADGKPLMMYGTHTNITESKIAEEKIQKTIKETIKELKEDIKRSRQQS